MNTDEIAPAVVGIWTLGGLLLYITKFLHNDEPCSLWIKLLEVIICGPMIWICVLIGVVTNLLFKDTPSPSPRELDRDELLKLLKQFTTQAPHKEEVNTIIRHERSPNHKTNQIPSSTNK